MYYVIKFGTSYLGNAGTLTRSQRDAMRVSASLKPFVTPDTGYRFVRLRPRDVEETEPTLD